MIKKLIATFKKLDNLTFKIMEYGLKGCFIICLVSISILLTYKIILHSPTLFYIGLSLFRLSCIFSIEFIICGLIVDSIKKQLI